MLYEIPVRAEWCFIRYLDQFLPTGLLVEPNQVRAVHVVQHWVEGRPQIPLAISPLVGYIQQSTAGSPTYQRHHEATWVHDTAILPPR
jgi:hypothetical protein